jgi:hypothetical protein
VIKVKLKEYAKNPMLLVFMATAAGIAGVVEDLIFEGLKGADKKRRPEKYEDGDSEDDETEDETEE